MAAGIVITGFVPLLLVVWIVAALLGGDGNDPAELPRRDPRLQVLEQALVEVDGDDLYVALVRNRSRSQSALRVRPEGEFVDEFGDPIGSPDDPAQVDNRPSLAPGEVGVVYDYITAGDSVADLVRRIHVRLVAGRWAAGAARAPLAVSRPRLDRRTCLVTTTVRSARRRLEVQLAAIARDRRGAITAAGTWLAGPLPRGSSRQVLARIDPRPCVRGRMEFYAYPNPRPGELLPRTSDGEARVARR
jgi:hypothetical protein